MPFELPPDLQRAYEFVKWVEQTVPPEISPFKKTTRAENVKVRNVCWYIMRTLWKMKLRQIGEIFKRDHSTVLHGLRSLTEEDKEHGRAIEREFSAQRKRR